MSIRSLLSLTLAGLVFTAPVIAQEMPDIGFVSVGRGQPLAASVHDQPMVGPGWDPPFSRVRADQKLYGYLPEDLPKDIKPLPVDLFTSKDFYADKDLWSDPRYFRCNSGTATEAQRGILLPNPLTNDTAQGPWGHCEVDYPRAAIISPYRFDTAQAHYEALMEETRKRGGPNKYTFKDFPAAEWNGVYQRPAGSRAHQNWYWMQHSQISTVLSLLTPKYQQSMVQEAYHQVRGNALWPSTFCWPEGFMRRWYPYAVWEHYITATPDMVQILAGVADNFITSIRVGREFNMEDVPGGGVPRLGAAVPRWYGDTVGFWDGDVLITWTSNIQPWKAHSAFEFSDKLQTIEIYTPNRDASGAFVGLNHEAILYDPEVLVEPIRIVRNLNKINDYTDADETPYAFIECIQTIFPIEGANVPVSHDQIIQHEVPDMYGRPWDKIWRKYFEQDMKHPDEDEDLFNFEK